MFLTRNYGKLTMTLDLEEEKQAAVHFDFCSKPKVEQNCEVCFTVEKLFLTL